MQFHFILTVHATLCSTAFHHLNSLVTYSRSREKFGVPSPLTGSHPSLADTKPYLQQLSVVGPSEDVVHLLLPLGMSLKYVDLLGRAYKPYSNGLMKPSGFLPIARRARFNRVTIAAQIGADADVPSMRSHPCVPVPCKKIKRLCPMAAISGNARFELL